MFSGEWVSKSTCHSPNRWDKKLVVPGAKHRALCSVQELQVDSPVMSLVASMMKMTEIKREKISSVKRVKNSTMLDKENTLMCRGPKRTSKQVRHSSTDTDQRQRWYVAIMSFKGGRRHVSRLPHRNDRMNFIRNL